MFPPTTAAANPVGGGPVVAPPIRIGDKIRVYGKWGTVTAVSLSGSWRHVDVRADSGGDYAIDPDRLAEMGLVILPYRGVGQSGANRWWIYPRC